MAPATPSDAADPNRVRVGVRQLLRGKLGDDHAAPIGGSANPAQQPLGSTSGNA